MGREDICQGVEGGPLAAGSGLGLQGWPAPCMEASGVGLGRVPRCLDAYVNFLQRFQLAKLTLLDVEQGCGLSGSCWAPACDTRGRNRSQREVLGASCHALCWSLSGHRGAHCTPQLCFPRAGSHVWVFPLVLDFISESPCPKGTLVFMVEGWRDESRRPGQYRTFTEHTLSSKHFSK